MSRREPEATSRLMEDGGTGRAGVNAPDPVEVESEDL